MFDVVVGNPPFQPNIKWCSKTGSAQKLWHLFIDLGFNISKQYVAMITPSHWRNGNFSRSRIKKVQQKMWKYKFIVVKDIDFGKTGGILKIGYWVIDKTLPNDELPIFQKYMFLPLRYPTIIKKYLTTLDLDNDFFIQDIVGVRRYRYDIIKKVKKGDKVHKYKYFNTYPQYKKGYYDWCDIKQPYYEHMKVVISMAVRLKTPGNKVAVFFKEPIGVGNAAFGYTVNTEEDGKKLEKWFNHSCYVKAIHREYNGYYGFSFPWNTFKKIPRRLVDDI